MKQLILYTILFFSITNGYSQRADGRRINSISTGTERQRYGIIPVVQPVIKHGYIYNWYAATDANLIANTGWNVPTIAQLITLRDYLGGWTVAGGALKDTGFVYWNSPNTGAINSVGFNARGSGHRKHTDGSFTVQGVQLELHSSEAGIVDNYTGIILFNTSAWFSLFKLTNANELKYGRSIRLIKASTTLSHGQTGTYRGNDGKLYKTICIGTQEWLSENLAETKYRNGEPIPIVTDNAAWVALTTGARCSYDNDESYVFE